MKVALREQGLDPNELSSAQLKTIGAIEKGGKAGGGKGAGWWKHKNHESGFGALLLPRPLPPPLPLFNSANRLELGSRQRQFIRV